MRVMVKAVDPVAMRAIGVCESGTIVSFRVKTNTMARFASLIALGAMPEAWLEKGRKFEVMRKAIRLTLS